MSKIHILFDGPPGPGHLGRKSSFVEVENDEGESIRAGKWFRRNDGLWDLEIDVQKLLDEKLI